MKRVEAAINEGRCVVAIGGRALSNDDVMAELRRRRLSAVALGADAPNPTCGLSEDTLAPVLTRQGGVLVLVEPDGASDGRALAELARLIKAGAHKPKLYVAARAFNPFGLPMNMRLMKIEQLKLRAADFISQLPLDVPVATPKLSKKERRKKEQAAILAPRPVFVGREEESAGLLSLLSEAGGPVVIHGPEGIGRRWLVEHCLAQTELERLPDLCFGRGTDHDAFMAMLAMICKDADEDTLHDLIRQPRSRPPASEMAGRIVEALQSEALANKVWVIDGLDSLLDRRDGSFYRDDALSAVLRAILTSQPALKILLIAKVPPTFYREGEAANLRTLSLGGLKGKELHDLFESWQIPEFPRDRFGPIVERTLGHPMASRYFGIAVRQDGDVDGLLKEPKFLKAKNLADLEPMGRHIKRRVSELEESLRLALSMAALFRTPATAQELQSLGIKRIQRITLLAQGLLEQTPLQDDRKYYVHPRVGSHLNPREVLDFEQMKTLAEELLKQSKSLKNAGKLAHSIALALDANRLLAMSRNGRSVVVLPYPDNDPIIENIREILRRKSPRFDIARMRLKEAMKTDSRNPKLYQIEVEISQQEGKKDFDSSPVWNKAIAECPVPDLFHAQATLSGRKNARGKAATALEAGVQVFPTNARLRRRLASVQLSQNRVEEARDTLKAAQDLEPMMPDTYSQLAEVYMRLGTEHLEEAKASLEEALRLEPEGAQHHARQGELHRIHAMVQSEERDSLLEAAEASLREAIRLEPNHTRTQVGLATILVDRGGDIEQAQWLIKKALKRSETADGLIQKARILIRQNVLEDVERLLDRATKKEPSNHTAFSVRAELWMAQGQIFHAFEALKTARERSPKGCPDRLFYEVQMKQLGALIESGQAAELLKAQGVAAEQASVDPESGSGPRRDAGTTTRLRKARSDEETEEAPETVPPVLDALEPDEVDASASVAAEEPVAEEPVAEEPVAEEPVAEEPVAEEPVAEEPVAEEPVAEEPVAEEPVAEEPAAEEPAAEA